MFTVKYVERAGYECVRNARTVDFHPGGEHDELATVVAYDVPGVADGIAQFTKGLIFVMNDQGRTVAHYDLDMQNRNRQEVPHNAAR